MEKRKPWQFALIAMVIFITLFNIFPTIFYYSKPLKDPVDEIAAREIAQEIVSRVNSLEEQATSWLDSFCNHIGARATSIGLVENNPSLVLVSFQEQKDADQFRFYLQKAGPLIPFAPAQLGVSPQQGTDPLREVYVQRRVAVHLPEEQIDSLFTFTWKEENGEVAPFYRELINDRVMQVALNLGSSSRNGRLVEFVTQDGTNSSQTDALVALSREIVDLEKVFGLDSALAQRLYASFTQSGEGNREGRIHQLISRFETASSTLKSRRDKLVNDQIGVKEKQGFLDAGQAEVIDDLADQLEMVKEATQIVRQNVTRFSAGMDSLTEASLQQILAETPEVEGIQTLSLEGRNPYVESLTIDWSNDVLTLNLYEDIVTAEEGSALSESASLQWEQLDQRVIDELARVSRQTDEAINPKGEGYVVAFNQLTNSSSLLALDLGAVAQQQTRQLEEYLLGSWHPKHSDLSRESFPVWDQETYGALSASENKLGLMIYAPSASAVAPREGFQRSSIYVIARGLDRIVEKYQEHRESADAELFLEDFAKLQTLLQNNGFIGYSGASYQMDPAHRRDYIFELPDYALNVLNATRETFSVHGSRRWAVLELTNLEQRLHTANRIDNAIHEDLLKWKDEYDRVQVALDDAEKLTVPPVAENPYWANLKLSTRKYLRGDDRKILKWGLDLSGGKTVRIGLLDQNNRPVTDPADLNQAVNELFTRINKMGVSEQTIRIENSHILLEFPGSQGLSASELIQGSTMTFHMVNEKFGRYNPALAQATQRFLQEVWNKAVVTNQRDAESLNQIAYENLGGDPEGAGTFRPQTPHAKLLFEAGLRFAPPKQTEWSHEFDDTVSMVALWRGDEPGEWQGAAHPLMLVFRNYALEGSSLESVSAGYDPTKGNILQFGVARSYASSERSGNPRNDFYAWTAQFAEERIAGTAKETVSGGRGWRMAVILNGQIISAPNLVAPLSDGGIISGSFSQRDVNRLAADLKAGSLSFTPKILSETNISADLGQAERAKGLYATMIGLVLVVAAMTGYYHFAGVIAAIAVLLNLLIMWGVLQNLDAALTLPGLAGIILTVGMAVDANVLVFERIREEFRQSGRIASAIQTGYRKAFSAIVDSNITTIMAALILLQFDAGPIKGFAVTLIIGIASSMFTALFVTRYFFAGWVQNPKNKELKMRDWIGQTNFDFLSKTKYVAVASVILISLGGFTLLKNQETILGLEFTGGYSLNVELQDDESGMDFRAAATEALLANEAVTTDFQVKKLNRPNQLNIQFGPSMEQEGRPWYAMEERLAEGEFAYGYLAIPKLNWVVDTLEHGGLDIKEAQKETLDQNWSAMSGQFSDAMRNNAMVALGCAMLAILVYITIRFEFKFAIAAIVALSHDVAISMGILALLHAGGVPLQITMEIVGALMTIIGYSLNATIVIFDRIREDSRLMRKASTREVVLHALNVTLSRTVMTSGTTALVLLSLVLLGGQSIFAFSFIMLMGVLFGTISSLFIACPVMLFFHRREEAKAEGELRLTKA